jgi:DNA-directed RNA polymerase specialized sigma24 family protein
MLLNSKATSEIIVGTFLNEASMRCVPQAETAAEFVRSIPKNIIRAARGQRRDWPRRPGRSRLESEDWPALEKLFLSSRERFVRVAYGVLSNREDAEDAVQDAFLSACRHFETFQGRCALTTWFTRIVINAVLVSTGRLARQHRALVLLFSCDENARLDFYYADGLRKLSAGLNGERLRVIRI